MLKQMEVFLIAVVFILITAILIIINTWHRVGEFKIHNEKTQHAVMQGATYAINMHLENRHRHVRLFIDEYKQLFIHLNHYPNDEKTANDIRIRLQQHFSDFFTFTITNQNGTPLLDNIDSLVGDICLQDLKKFSETLKYNTKKLKNKVFIHPQPFNYHYDIMAPITINGSNSSIMFSSFYLKEIADILKTHEIPSQRLILVNQSDLSLIEVSREGARDQLSRDIHLTEDEQDSIKVKANIPDTAWRIVVLSDANFESDYVHKLWKEAIITMLIVAFALFLIIIVLIRVQNKRIAR